MTTSVPFRLGAAAFVVLTLPAVTSADRCVAQEAARRADGPGLLQGADDPRSAADLRARVRVLVASVRAVPLLVRDPDEAHALLRKVLEAVREDPDLSESCRERLQAHLELAFWGVANGGIVVKRLGYEAITLKAELRARLDFWRFQLDRWKLRLGLLPGME
jgi:hypothetical protein